MLEVLHNGQSAGPNGRVCVATTHIYQNQGFPNVKIWQVMTLVRELEKFTVPRQLPLVLTGDFNSQLDSAVYEFLQKNNVSPQHPEVSEDAQVIVSSHSCFRMDGLKSERKMTSSLKDQKCQRLRR